MFSVTGKNGIHVLASMSGSSVAKFKKGWKEMFYLTMYSTRFSDILSTFYLQLYGKCHIAENIEVAHQTDRIVHTTAFVIPVVEYWLEQILLILNTVGQSYFSLS